MQTPIHILHVDDDPSFTNVSKKILEVEGPFKVEVAHSVDEALTKIENDAFDVVLSDYYMPVKTGLDFLKALREKNSDIPFILFTGKGREEIIVQALNLGADRYVDKLGEPEVVYTELAVSICQLHEKALAKKKLWESEERFEKMVTNSNDLIMLTESDGRILYLSPSCKQVLGYDPAELVGKMPWVIHTDDLERVQKIFHKAITEKVSGTAEYRIVTKQEETRWVTHSYSQIIENNKIKQVVSIVRDVTERKKYEEKIRESEEHFRLATKNSPIVMATLDKNLRYIWQHNLRIKLPEGGVIGKKFGETVFIEKRKSLSKLLRELLKTGQPLRHEVTIHIEDFTFILDCYFEPSRNTEKEITGVHFVAYDITERKKAEEALLESEKKFSAAFNSSGAALIISMLSDGSLVEVNDCFLKTYGYTREEVIGKTSTELNLYVDINQRERIIASLKKTKIVTNKEVKTRRKNGAEVTVLVSSKIISIKNQPHLLSTLVDISGLKQTEQALFLRQKELENFIDMAPDAVTLIDARGRIIDCNKIACKMFGYQREEVVGRFGADFVSENNRGRLEKSLQTTSKRRRRIQRFCCQTTKGEKVILEGSVKAIRDHSGKPAAFLAITRDITDKIKKEQRIVQLLEKSRKREMNLRRLLLEHKETLRKLCASEERYRFLAEHAEDILAVTDANGTFLYISPSVKRLLGLSPEELIGKKSILQFISQEDFARLNPKMESLIKNGGSEPLEFCLKNSLGADVWLEVKIGVVNDDSGEIRFISVGRDITQRKKDHEERDLALAQAQLLLEKLTVVGGLVRHDIKNKLSAVTCSLYSAKKYASNNPQVLQQIEAVNNATSNITRILDLAQTYQAVGDQGLSWIPLFKAIDEAIRLLSDQKNVKVNVDGIGFEVLADSALVEIFHNLIENSLKYGGQNLSFIKIHAEKEENSSLKIFYEDDGGGIDELIKPRLFEKGAGIGSGLGLYLIQRICSVYGWKIQEHGIAGIGVCFVLEIPPESTRPSEVSRWIWLM
ncbi:MAG: PAS domain S-box protein [Candidatus Bathyarchaeia archaeon]|jgi:PAS domain S-box-containing protein